jgi:hypothetical protein
METVKVGMKVPFGGNFLSAGVSHKKKGRSVVNTLFF